MKNQKQNLHDNIKKHELTASNIFKIKINTLLINILIISNSFKLFQTDSNKKRETSKTCLFLAKTKPILLPTQIEQI